MAQKRREPAIRRVASGGPGEVVCRVQAVDVSYVSCVSDMNQPTAQCASARSRGRRPTHRAQCNVVAPLIARCNRTAPLNASLAETQSHGAHGGMAARCPGPCLEQRRLATGQRPAASGQPADWMRRVGAESQCKGKSTKGMRTRRPQATASTACASKREQGQSLILSCDPATCGGHGTTGVAGVAGVAGATGATGGACRPFRSFTLTVLWPVACGLWAVHEPHRAHAYHAAGQRTFFHASPSL